MLRYHLSRNYRWLMVHLAGVLLALLLLSACQPGSARPPVGSPTPASTINVAPAATTSPTPDAAALVEGTRQALSTLMPQAVTAAPTMATETRIPVTPTPYTFPDPLTPPPVCAAAPPTRLILQERARVLDDDPRALRMRAGPGTSHDVVATIPVNGVFLVLEGPTCSERYAWYYVRYRGQEGWIAEGDDTMYFVEPFLPG